VIRVLVVDDHDIVRRGLTSALGDEPDIEVVGQAANGREAINRAVELEPDVVVMDILMPELGGLEATSALAHRMPQTKVLIVTISDREEDLFHAVKFGARGYLLKSAPIEDVVTAIRQVAEGEAILCLTNCATSHSTTFH
jgi:two-component system NarL family response regulator